MDINERITSLTNLEIDLDNFNSFLDSFDSIDYDKLMKDISPSERCELNWNYAYAQYTLYFLWLKVNNKDPKDHQIKDEIKRIQEYYGKLSKVKNDVLEKNSKSNENKEISKQDMVYYNNKLNQVK